MNDGNSKVIKNHDTVPRSTSKVKVLDVGTTMKQVDNPIKDETGVVLQPSLPNHDIKIKEIEQQLIDGDIDYPVSLIDFVPSGPRVLVELTIQDFPIRMLLQDKVPDNLPIKSVYRIVGITSNKYKLGSEIVLDTYSGGSETEVVDEFNGFSFIKMRKYITELDNQERAKLFIDTPTVKIIGHFVILEGNIAAIKKLNV